MRHTIQLPKIVKYAQLAASTDNITIPVQFYAWSVHRRFLNVLVAAPRVALPAATGTLLMPVILAQTVQVQ